MKKAYVTIAVMVLSAMGYLAFLAPHARGEADWAIGGADAGGDDADGRYAYELARLRDPASGKIPDNVRQKELEFAMTLPKDNWVAGAYSGATSAGLVWSARGPWNVGGRTRAMALDVTNERYLVAGSCSGGMWRSTDAGASWTACTPINSYPSVSCLVQDTRPGHQANWYYGSGEAYGASASATGAYYLGTGVFHSADSGKTWNVIPATSGLYSIFSTWAQVAWNIVVNPADTANTDIYVAAYGGIYKSTNGGTTWSTGLGSYLSSTVSYFSDIAITSHGVIYATLSSDGPSKGIYRSVDGTTFTNITPVGFPDSFNRCKIGISPADESQVYFLCNTPSSGMPDTNYLGTVEWNSLWKYYYKSGTGADTGGVWRNLSANLPSSGGQFDKFTCQGSYDLVVKPKPDDTGVVFIGGTNVYRSNSGFNDNSHTTFIGGYVQGASLPVVKGYLNHHPDQHELWFVPSDPTKMYSSNDGGVFFTGNNMADTVAWTNLNNGYLNSMFYTCAINHTSTDSVVIGGAQDNGSWFTNTMGATTPWVSPSGGDGSFCAIGDSGRTYYMSIQSGKTRKMRLSAGGATDSFARIDPIGGTNYQFVNPFLLDPNNNSIMYMAGGKYLWRNDNLAGIPFANNWDSISTNWVKFPDSIPGLKVTITALGISTVPANRLYVGTSAQKIYRIDSANVGTPAMHNVTSTLFSLSGNVACIAVNPTNADSVIAVFSNYNIYSLFFSSNGGTTWSRIGGNLEPSTSGTGNGPSVRWATFAHTADGLVYFVGTSIGLYATSVLNGISTVWTQMGSSTIGESVVDMMDYRTTDGLLTVATHSHGIFSTYLNSVTDVLGINSLLQQSSASLNFTAFPNPFNAATSLQFTLQADSHVKITVCDGLGREVGVPTNGEFDKGTHRVSFEGMNLSLGTYYCTLTTGTYRETIKLLMMR